MQKFISSIRNKKLKGNVSLLVILILLASSVIALLSISQIQHLITYGDMTFNYFRAFYLAKAGTELGLTEVYNRENGFEDKIENEIKEDGSIEFNEMIAKNFLGDNDEYAGAKPYFDMKIVSNFETISNDVRYECNSENMITLEPKISTPGQESPGEGIVLSLFKDNTTGFRNILNSEYLGEITPLSDGQIKSLTFGNPGGNFIFGLFGYDDNANMSDITVEIGNDLNTFLWENIGKVNGKTRRYLTIKNYGDSPVSFCIQNENGKHLIPYSHYLIDVRGHYADMEVGLQSIAKKDIPSWSLNVLGWEE